jgi:hypothetical protein
MISSAHFVLPAPVFGSLFSFLFLFLFFFFFCRLWRCGSHLQRGGGSAVDLRPCLQSLQSNDYGKSSYMLLLSNCL